MPTPCSASADAGAIIVPPCTISVAAPLRLRLMARLLRLLPTAVPTAAPLPVFLDVLFAMHGVLWRITRCRKAIFTDMVIY
jgi:hypothetical protein